MPFIDGIHLWLLHSTASNINVYFEQESKLIDIPNCAKVQSLNKRQPASKGGLQKAWKTSLTYSYTSERKLV